jgi:hypothetical protein
MISRILAAKTFFKSLITAGYMFFVVVDKADFLSCQGLSGRKVLESHISLKAVTQAFGSGLSVIVSKGPLAASYKGERLKVCPFSGVFRKSTLFGA